VRLLRSPLAVAAALIAVAAGCGEGSEPSSESAGQAVGTVPDRAWTPAAVGAGNLRIATYNVRNFPKDEMEAADASASPGVGAEVPEEDSRPAGQGPGADRPAPLVRKQRETDEAMLLGILEKLDFDVLALQEVHDTARFDTLLARLGDRTGRAYAAVYSHGWAHPQHLGLVVRADRLRIVRSAVHPDVATRATLRAGFSARVESVRAGGVDFGVMVLHLASGDTASRATLRAEQATAVAKAVAAEIEATGDHDFVVLGDMNTARAERELPAFEAAMASAASGLARAEPASACSTYFTKSPQNPLLSPSFIDHVFLGSMAERDTAVPLASGAHCAERACQPFESDSAQNGTSYWSVSDHCPVYFEIADRDLD